MDMRIAGLRDSRTSSRVGDGRLRCAVWNTGASPFRAILDPVAIGPYRSHTSRPMRIERVSSAVAASSTALPRATPRVQRRRRSDPESMGVDERRRSGWTRKLNVDLLCGPSDIHGWSALFGALSPSLGVSQCSSWGGVALSRSSLMASSSRLQTSRSGPMLDGAHAGAVHSR